MIYYVDFLGYITFMYIYVCVHMRGGARLKCK